MGMRVEWRLGVNGTCKAVEKANNTGMWRYRAQAHSTSPWRTPRARLTMDGDGNESGMAFGSERDV